MLSLFGRTDHELSSFVAVPYKQGVYLITSALQHNRKVDAEDDHQTLFVDSSREMTWRVRLCEPRGQPLVNWRVMR